MGLYGGDIFSSELLGLLVWRGSHRLLWRSHSHAGNLETKSTRRKGLGRHNACSNGFSDSCIHHGASPVGLKGDGGSLFSAMRIPPKYETSIFWLDLPIKSTTYIQSNADVSALLESIQIGTPILWIVGICILIPFGFRKKWTWIAGFGIALSIPMGSAVMWSGLWIPTGYAWLHSVFPPLARCTLPHRMIPAAIIIGLTIGA